MRWLPWIVFALAVLIVYEVTFNYSPSPAAPKPWWQTLLGM